MKQPRNSEEMLAYARSKGSTIGQTITIGTVTYRMCSDETGRTFLHQVNTVLGEVA